MPRGLKPAGTLVTLRRLLVALMIFGASGLLVELALLEHWGELRLWGPMLVLAVSIPLAVRTLVSPIRQALLVLRACMLVMIGSGLLGVWFHLEGNLAFERELYPTHDVLPLLLEAFKGATPTLAPGALIQLGLLGLLTTLPVLTLPAAASNSPPPASEVE
jgi:hypothetical protein